MADELKWVELANIHEKLKPSLLDASTVSLAFAQNEWGKVIEPILQLQFIEMEGFEILNHLQLWKPKSLVKDKPFYELIEEIADYLMMCYMGGPERIIMTEPTHTKHWKTTLSNSGYRYLIKSFSYTFMGKDSIFYDEHHNNHSRYITSSYIHILRVIVDQGLSDENYIEILQDTIKSKTEKFKRRTNYVEN